MSCIEEHTIVIASTEEDALLKDYNHFKDTHHRIRDFELVYKDDKVCVYRFDANGDGPWETEDSSNIKATLLAAETCYLDESELWTRIEGCDSDITISEWLKGKIPEGVYAGVIKQIAYSA